MSRIFVRNLPQSFTENEMKKHFSESGGTVTDVQLKRTADGKSRRFGYVGFKTEKDAQGAVKNFNKSFVNTMRIEVEMARSIKDPSLMTQQEKRERQKRRRDEAGDDKRMFKQQKTEEPDAKEAKLREYLDVMGTRKSAKSWANDDESGAHVQDEAAPAKPLVDEKGSDDEYENANPEELKSEDEDEEMMPLTVDSGLADSGVSDMEWLQQRRTRMVDGEKAKQSDHKQEQELKQPGPEAQLEPEPELEKSEHEKKIEEITESRRLFLRNLLYSCSEDDLRDLFSKYGAVEEAHLPIDPKKNKSKGFAYVMFKNGEDAAYAFESLDGSTFQGRLLHILPGKPKREHKLDEFDLKNLPLKKQNELKRKAQAAKQQFSWNSLYMNPDSVMGSVANKLGVSKAQLLSPESSDAAVQQALAETTVINNVREYFESKGVDLLSFNQKERSDTVILVKNLPYDTTMDELADKFSQHGDIKKMLMPPDGGIAIVVFRTVPQGRAAFAKLAFSRFRNTMLYLEKGPKGLLEDGSDVPEADDGTSQPQGVEAKTTASDLFGNDEQTDDADAVERTSVFVKNLNFSTTSDQLSSTFRALAGFITAHVKTRADKNDSSKRLSDGYGFVEFKTKRDAQVAVDAMDGYLLDGHKLQCKISHRGHEDDEKADAKLPKSKGQTKIIIKNVPFETTKQDIKKLFGTFGQLRSVRVPKRFDKRARGFAFAEFVTAKEAENAMRALRGTHLLGRPLVMQYAEADAASAEEEIQRMEQKTKKQLNKEAFSGLRLSGKRSIELGDENGDMDM